MAAYVATCWATMRSPLFRWPKLHASSIDAWRARLLGNGAKPPMVPAGVNRILNDLRAALNAAATGVRHSQIQTLRVGGLQPERQRVLMPGSKKEKISKPKAPVPIPLSPERLAALGRGGLPTKRFWSDGAIEERRRLHAGSATGGARGGRPTSSATCGRRRSRKPTSPPTRSRMPCDIRRSCDACAPGCRSASSPRFTTRASR